MAMGKRRKRSPQQQLWVEASRAKAPGHPFYKRAGDARCRAVFEAAWELAPRNRTVAILDAAVRVMEQADRPPPNVDFGAVALRAALGMPPGAVRAHAECQYQFLRAIEADRPTSPSLTDGLHIQAAMAAAEQPATAGGWVRIADIL